MFQVALALSLKRLQFITNLGGLFIVITVFALLTIYSELLTTQGREKRPFLMTVELAANHTREFMSTTCDGDFEW